MTVVPQFDKDLLALQRARDLLANARAAATEFARLDEAAAKEIARKVAEHFFPKAEAYAEMELEEGGFGKIADKVYKNQAGSRGTYDAWKDKKLGGVRMVDGQKLVEIGRPAGVVVGLSNSTSPVATVLFKSIICLMTRNAIVFSPHPALGKCTIAAAQELAEVAESAGAPRNAVQILETPTIDAVNTMMASEDCDLILATGGGPMVRAAYSSGNPALGVGPGNAPVYVDRSADLDLAAEMILEGKDFDHGTPCSAPSVVLADKPVAEALKRKMQERGGHVFCEQGTDALRAHAFPGGKLNLSIIGKASEKTARAAGLSVAPGCRALIGTVTRPDRTEPLLKEKLSPVLGFVEVDGIDGAIDVAREMLTLAGAGHSSAIYTQDSEQAVFFGAALDYYRVVVNGQITMGAIGMNTDLPPTFTIGTGFAGRSSVGHNVGADDLIDWKKVAFPLEEIKVPAPSQASQNAALPDTWKTELRALLREELARSR